MSGRQIRLPLLAAAVSAALVMLPTAAHATVWRHLRMPGHGCAAPAQASHHPGAHVILARCSGSRAEDWAYMRDHQIRLRGTGEVLSVGTPPLRRAVLRPASRSAARWRFQPVFGWLTDVRLHVHPGELGVLTWDARHPPRDPVPLGWPHRVRVVEWEPNALHIWQQWFFRP